MSKWFRAEKSRVIEVININPNGNFHPSLIWFEDPTETVQVGYLVDSRNIPYASMDVLKKKAIETAMEYGNRITQREMGQWAGVEPYSWSQQKEEATLLLRDGRTLGDYALLPVLALDKGVPLEEYAEDVMRNAVKYQEVLRAAVNLRRLAVNALSNPAIDTPEKLERAVADLAIIADTIAMKLIGPS